MDEVSRGWREPRFGSTARRVPSDPLLGSPLPTSPPRSPSPIALPPPGRGGSPRPRFHRGLPGWVPATVQGNPREFVDDAFGIVEEAVVGDPQDPIAQGSQEGISVGIVRGLRWLLQYGILSKLVQTIRRDLARALLSALLFCGSEPCRLPAGFPGRLGGSRSRFPHRRRLFDAVWSSWILGASGQSLQRSLPEAHRGSSDLGRSAASKPSGT